MINHYLELHEYINKNIYKFPVKEDDIILEGINWGSILKGGLALLGIGGLIILFKNFLLPLLNKEKKRKEFKKKNENNDNIKYKNEFEVLKAAIVDQKLEDKLKNSQNIINYLKNINDNNFKLSIDNLITRPQIIIDLPDDLDYFFKYFIICKYIYIKLIDDFKLTKENINFLVNNLNFNKSINNLNDLQEIQKNIFNIIIKFDIYNELKPKSYEDILNELQTHINNYLKKNNIDIATYNQNIKERILKSNIEENSLNIFIESFKKLEILKKVCMKIESNVLDLCYSIYCEGNNIKSNTKKNENKSDVSDQFKSAVAEKNKLVVVTILQGNLLVDKTFKHFDEMCEYAIKNGISDLYDKHNGEVFLKESEWNKEYMDKEMTILIRNFSKERIEIIKKMIDKIYNKTNTNGRPISDEFKKEVTNSNILGIRTMLKNSLLVDKSFIQFNTMIKYALDNGINKNELYDKYDQKPFKSKEEWNTAYMNQQLVRLVDNFCIERITLLKEIINKLYNNK